MTELDLHDIINQDKSPGSSSRFDVTLGKPLLSVKWEHWAS